MGNVTSMDLRSRIVQAVEVEGMSRRGAAERFMVCPSTATKLLKHKETTGGVAPKKIGGRLHNLEPRGHAARHRRGNAGHDIGEDRKRGRCAWRLEGRQVERRPDVEAHGIQNQKKA
jgi:transposase